MISVLGGNMKIGDTVKVLKGHYSKFAGKTGVVRTLNGEGELVGVEFKGSGAGHLLGAILMHDDGWYFAPSNLKAVRKRKPVRKLKSKKKARRVRR
jgi:hypothetical protein